MASQRHMIIGYATGFVVSIAIVGGLAWLMTSLNNHSGGQAPAMTTLIIFGGTLAVVTLVPLFFLKKLMRLSRHVAHDGSHFEVKDVTEHQDRPHISYH